MEPHTYFLSFARLAPTQVATWGHPLTTGIPNIDYFISSRELEVEDAESHYTEQLVKLEELNTYYIRPACRDLITKDLLGVAKAATLYICPQTLFKFHPDFDPIVERILDADPTGQLVLIEGHCARHTRLLRERIERTIPKVANRIRFIPRLSQEQFLSLVKTADVMLDPTHFGGGSTTIQALSFGTPVVTLPSKFLRGRISYACYRHMGLSELIAKDVDHYCEIATNLGRSAEMRAALRPELATKSEVLFSNEKVIVECENFLEMAFSKHTV
jgi:predicted O-linked N-acetylglucosamine transferase (SPINDLY family)